MERLLWIGPRRAPTELKPMLAAQGTELLSFESADEALRATTGVPVAAAIITAGWPEAPSVVEALIAARPEVQIVMATDVGVPRTVLLGLWAGASTVVDFRSESRAEIIQQIQESISRHRQAARERELLLRLRSLNEDFLKNVVALEKRNLELEEKLRPEAAQLAAQEDGPARVLIVDDEEVVRQVLEQVLGKRGHSYISVENAENAIVELRKKPFHLIITDKNLPGITGLDLIREAKNASPETEAILMTGYSSMDSAIDALNSGASAYLEKPFDHVKTVADKIDGVLARQKDRNKKRQYLHVIKERNRMFLEQYRAIRADLEAWLTQRGAPAPDSVPLASGDDKVAR